ncbi:MAG: M12 family metallo-peptidase [Actinomycetota bacterium]|nr:M12 family metallo-peptidase [Actinomycetota bacterium]
MRRLFLLMLVAVVAAALLAGSSPAIGSPTARIIDEEEPPDCTELVPESVSVSGVTDGGKTVSLDVYVLLDFKQGAAVAAKLRRARRTGNDSLRREAKAEFQAMVAEAKKHLAKAPSSYAPLDIKLNFKKWGLLDQPRKRIEDSQKIINLSRKQFGGTRPRGFDIVYTLTDLDMTAPGLGRAVAGQADCIGGVRYDRHAFAVGEISQYENLEFGPLTFYYAATSKIASHEIGHLMGAHHHYQDCVEGIPTEAEHGEPSPCTLMSNFVDFQSLNFSVVEGAVVRGHALDFAAANDR